MTPDLHTAGVRWLRYMFTAAAILSPITLVLPHAGGYDVAGLVVVTVAAAATAVLLRAFGARLSELQIHFVVAAGALLTGAVINVARLATVFAERPVAATRPSRVAALVA